MDFYQQGPGRPDLFATDATLRWELERRLPSALLSDTLARCAEVGRHTTASLPDLAEAAEAQPPQHVPYDAWGRRVDRIDTSPAWRELKAFAASHRMVASGHDRALGPHGRLVQTGLLHVYSASSATFACPLAMTDAAARVLQDQAQGAWAERLVENLLSTDPAQFITSGQWMTERAGGSDVGGTETVARPVGADPDTERYTLHGTKWFTSATTSEMALTLARIEDPVHGTQPGSRGLTMFCVEVCRDSDGGLEGIRVNRLKDKLGTKALPTAELTLDGVRARRIGAPGRGVPNIATMLNITRWYNTIAATSGMARAAALARDYAQRRVAFGTPLAQLPLHAETLADLEAHAAGALAMSMELGALLGAAEHDQATPAQLSMLRGLVPLAKLTTGKQAVAVASEALECFGGAGYVEDTGLPRLLRDAQVLPIWEGTTNVLSLDVLRAQAREGALTHVLAQLSQRAAALDGALGPVGLLQDSLRACTALVDRSTQTDDPRGMQRVARRLALTAGRCAQLVFLAETETFVRAQDANLAPPSWFARLCALHLAGPLGCPG